jgi:hypothetical protein
MILLREFVVFQQGIQLLEVSLCKNKIVRNSISSDELITILKHINALALSTGSVMPILT